MIIFNEIDYCKKVINEGIKPSRKGKDLFILAKYLWSICETKEEVLLEMTLFCERKLRGFNRVKDYKMLEDIVKNAKKYELKGGKEVVIYEEELEIINKEKDRGVRQLMFGLLTLSKMENVDFVNCGNKDIYKFSQLKKIHSYNLKQAMIEALHYLYDKGLIDVPIYKNQEVETYKIDFRLLEGTEAIRFVVNENSLLEYYNYYDPLDYMRCKVCGSLEKKKTRNSRQMYCKECKAAKRKEKNM